MHPRVVLALLLLIGSALACDEGTTDPDDTVVFRPTSPRVLSTGSPGKDEDPSVLRARDGMLYVAWFSERSGNSDIYLTRTRDGVTWEGARRITTHADRDHYPSLMQSADGALHLVWFRWTAGFAGTIWHARSADGTTWGAEEPVTSDANVDDWVPTMAQTLNGTLRVYFVSDARNAMSPASDLYVASQAAGSSTWTAPTPVVGVNSNAEHDHLPAAARVNNEIALLWVRHDTSVPQPWLNPKSQVWYATSADGFTFSSAFPVTNDAGNVVNLFPTFYTATNGTSRALWITTRTGSPSVVELPVSGLLSYPTGLKTLTALPGAGYSHRVARTSTPGVYLAAWVQGAEGIQDVYTRFFEN